MARPSARHHRGRPRRGRRVRALGARPRRRLVPQYPATGTDHVSIGDVEKDVTFAEETDLDVNATIVDGTVTSDARSAPLKFVPQDTTTPSPAFSKVTRQSTK
jgi:hypothetical protein